MALGGLFRNIDAASRHPCFNYCHDPAHASSGPSLPPELDCRGLVDDDRNLRRPEFARRLDENGRHATDR